MFVVVVAVAVDVAVAVAVAVVVAAVVVGGGGGGFACPMHSTEKFATTVLSKCVVCVLRGTNGLLDAHFEGGDMCKCSHHPFRQRQKKTTASYIMAGASWHESIP